eukprot:6182958-Pleurochrysis_carterae.AAC.1
MLRPIMLVVRNPLHYPQLVGASLSPNMLDDAAGVILRNGCDRFAKWGSLYTMAVKSSFSSNGVSMIHNSGTLSISGQITWIIRHTTTPIDNIWISILIYSYKYSILNIYPYCMVNEYYTVICSYGWIASYSQLAAIGHSLSPVCQYGSWMVHGGWIDAGSC